MKHEWNLKHKKKQFGQSPASLKKYKKTKQKSLQFHSPHTKKINNKMSNDYFFIVSEHNPNLVLDIEGGSANQGAKLITWTYHGGENQRFRWVSNLVALNTESFLNLSFFCNRFNPQGFIVSAKSGLVLDVEGGPNQGAKIIQWPAHGGANQRWRLHKVRRKKKFSDLFATHFFKIRTVLSALRTPTSPLILRVAPTNKVRILVCEFPLFLRWKYLQAL